MVLFDGSRLVVCEASMLCLARVDWQFGCLLSS